MTVYIRAFNSADTEAVVSLWETCGLTRPWNDPRADIARKLSVQPELFLVATEGQLGTVVGSAMAGYDGHRGWVYYLATAPTHRGQGIGAALMRKVERMLHDLGCPKVHLMVRSDNEQAAGFYERLGYETVEVGMLGRRLIVD